jgi:integrase/recombinase XerD
MKKLPTYLTKDEFKKLIKNTRQQHHKVAFLLGFESGLRISEALNLEPRDIEGNTMKVRQGKGGKDRIVPLPKSWKQNMLSVLPIKEKCSVRALQFAFTRSCKRAGLLKNKPELHFHSLRHSFGTILSENGVPIHHIRDLMGHSNITTTGVYLRMNPKQALDSYKELF